VKRNGLKGTPYGLIDDLTYTNVGNHLMRVEDAISGDYETDFVNGNSGTDDYSYYADGCLQKDLNQDITDIDYDTHLNKPVLVTLGSGEWIRYIYDGAGSLIRRELSDGTVWDYLGSMILKDGVPYQIAMAEGRVIYEGNTWHNEYEYRDQVGNLRVAFTERDGRLQKTYSGDYYPFGMAFNQKVFTPAPNKFTFHGHESTPDLGLRMTMMGARCYNQTIGRYLANDSYSSAAPNWTGYRLGWNQPMNVNDPTGNMEISDGYGTISGAAAVDYSGPQDWVLGKNGNIYWDNNATSQETTQAGDTYLGQDLTFTFNSYISDTYDGPLAPWEVTGNKLTSTIILNATKNVDGSLMSVSVSSSDPVIGATGGYSIFKGRDYFPSLGSDQNKNINLTGTPNFSATYEQHASVPAIEAFMLKIIGYDAVNVAQRLNMSLSGNQLSLKAYTDVFPSATLDVNRIRLFQYTQPSFKATHGRDYRMYGEHLMTQTPRRPKPNFYNRYNK
jgi:RHS repeat-associated protein